jgi:hypothetical protein
MSLFASISTETYAVRYIHPALLYSHTIIAIINSTDEMKNHKLSYNGTQLSHQTEKMNVCFDTTPHCSTREVMFNILLKNVTGSTVFCATLIKRC